MNYINELIIKKAEHKFQEDYKKMQKTLPELLKYISEKDIKEVNASSEYNLMDMINNNWLGSQFKKNALPDYIKKEEEAFFETVNEIQEAKKTVTE